MARHRRARRTVRQALAAPVDGKAGIAARCEIGGGAAIFLDRTRCGRERSAPCLCHRPARRPCAGAGRQPRSARRRAHRPARRPDRRERARRRHTRLRTGPSRASSPVPMSPSTDSLPVMKAVVGFMSPSRIAWNTSALAVSVTSAASSPCAHAVRVDHDRPFAGDDELGHAVEAARHLCAAARSRPRRSRRSSRSSNRDRQGTGLSCRPALHLVHYESLRTALLNCIVAALLPILLCCDACTGADGKAGRACSPNCRQADAGGREADRARNLVGMVEIRLAGDGPSAGARARCDGRRAICEAAIEHLTALTDHAPDFAEGWNARATAYFQAGEYGPSIDDIAQDADAEPAPFRGAVGAWA